MTHRLPEVRSGLILFLAILAFCGFVYLQQPHLTIFMIGDSTMADKPLEDNPERGWGQMLPRFFDSTVTVENHAKNGRSTRSFLAEDRWNPILAKLRPGDVVIIQFGHNDESREKVDRYTPPDDFRKNLTRFVTETREKLAIPILCTPIVRRRFDAHGMFYDVHGEYPGLVREVAAGLDVPLIDMHCMSEAMVTEFGEERSKEIFLWIQPGVYASLPDGKEDNTHFSEYGAIEMAKLAVRGIRELGIGLESRLLP
jgi:lysophospholipase L1-like esterase